MPTAIGFSRFGAPEVLHPVRIETPRPGPGQALVRVRAAGVNPVDCKIRRGDFADTGPRHFPHRLGNEFAGTVVALGPDNPAESTVAVGTDVLGSASAQAYTESLAVDIAGLAVKPPSLPWEMAAGLPAAGQTARTALSRLNVGAGDVVLVHAAAGGVGTMAVQLAGELGARVIGTAGEANHAYLRGLGATPVSYGPGLTERVRTVAPGGVDAALDLVGGEAVTTSLALVGERRRIGTTVDQHAVEEYGVQRMGGRSYAALHEVADLAAADRLTLPVRTFPLGEAASAHRAVETGHVRGKVVLSV
ncbi:NADP-dependent oxidoreductase [Streptomonospora salina]|uniref:Enoyl reductase n=1 Tax=Streptomonospora salina TaxID=104205 RepID=A0A841EJD8_9ACTN|nr:NADP-dependent oxidoreductase [Streptomonospora salina]MBB6000908.1 enoyl reductase [Streptomonospora salina]